jgi:glucose/arabinose dehydrogenase
MNKFDLRLPLLSLLIVGLIACSQTQAETKAETQPSPSSVAASPTATLAGTAADTDLTQLFSRAWRVTNAPSQPAPGSIYIFLPNGTLLETSCVETYRIATWTIDKAAPRVLRVVEDGRLAFTATIAELTNTTLRLQQNLVPSNEKRDITLTAVEQEFVCPDLPK